MTCTTTWLYLCGVLVSECFSGFPDLIREVTHVLGCVLAERLEVVQRHVAEQLLMEREEFTLNHYYSATLTKLRNRMAAESKKIKEDTTEGSSFFVRTVWNDAVADNCTEDGLPALTSEAHYMPHIRKAGENFGTATVDTNQRADAACPLPVSNMDHAVLETQVTGVICCVLTLCTGRAFSMNYRNFTPPRMLDAAVLLPQGSIQAPCGSDCRLSAPALSALLEGRGRGPHHRGSDGSGLAGGAAGDPDEGATGTGEGARGARGLYRPIEGRTGKAACRHGEGAGLSAWFLVG
jgi:hypothetical protein